MRMRTWPLRRLVPLFALLWLCAAAETLAQTQAQAPPQSLIRSVRAAIAQNDFPAAEQLIAAERKAHGVTPDVLEALSWLGRGALAAQRWDQADAYARDTYALSQAALRDHPVEIGRAHV